MCTGKIVSENVKGENTENTLHGKLIIHLTKSVTVGNSTTSTQAAHFFYDAQSRPAFVRYGGKYYRYVHNLQGDIIAILDTSGNTVVEYKYDAWGNPISVTGSKADNIGKLNPFRYRGYVWDEETQLFYNKARYYNSLSCRFINSDNIFDINAKVSIYNRFAYCDNCPIIYIDTEGHALFSILTQLAIGFVVGAIVGGAMAAIQGGDTKDIFEAAILGGLSGAISVIPVFKNPYLNSAIMGGVGNTASEWLGGKIDSLHDVISTFSEGAGAGLVGQYLGDALVNYVDDYWKQLSRSQRKQIISDIGKTDQALINEVYKSIRNGVSQNTLHCLIKEYGIDVMVSVFVSSVGTGIN